MDGKFLSLDVTPFYVESGGQVDDTGSSWARVSPRKSGIRSRREQKIVHEVDCSAASTMWPASRSVPRVDERRRRNIQRNHSATHLVHEALRRVLGTHVQQQGSLVAPDRLRFDFNHFEKIPPDQIRAIEDIVNEKIADGIGCTRRTTESRLADRRAGAGIPTSRCSSATSTATGSALSTSIRAFLRGVLRRHPRQAQREIGLFKIVAETSVASGIRRIEALTGDGLRRWIEGLVESGKETDEQIGKLVAEKQALEKELGLAGGKSSSPAR